MKTDESLILLNESHIQIRESLKLGRNIISDIFVDFISSILFSFKYSNSIQLTPGLFLRMRLMLISTQIRMDFGQSYQKTKMLKLLKDNRYPILLSVAWLLLQV